MNRRSAPEQQRSDFRPRQKVVTGLQEQDHECHGRCGKEQEAAAGTVSAAADRSANAAIGGPSVHILRRRRRGSSKDEHAHDGFIAA
jgi:hypothetical protein